MNAVDPIQETLTLYQDFYNEVLEKRKTLALIIVNDISGDIVVSLAQKFANLLKYTLDQFGEEPCTEDDLKKLTRPKDREELLLSDLTSIPRGTIPMFVMKQVVNLENFRIHFKVKDVNDVWIRFVNRYSDIVPKISY